MRYEEIVLSWNTIRCFDLHIYIWQWPIVRVKDSRSRSRAFWLRISRKFWKVRQKSLLPSKTKFTMRFLLVHWHLNLSILKVIGQAQVFLREIDRIMQKKLSVYNKHQHLNSTIKEMSLVDFCLRSNKYSFKHRRRFIKALEARAFPHLFSAGR